ncbi:MAG: hypothetical protein WAN11_22415, partial [Syntrophobacteraceae bacterium]
SGCRLAALNPFVARYYRLIGDAQWSLENSAFFCSLFTIHYSPFTIHAVITCYCRESNPKLSIKSVCCAISPCIRPVFTGITVTVHREFHHRDGTWSGQGEITEKSFAGQDL